MSLLKGTRVTWLGHATVLVELASGASLLIDPFIEYNPKYPKNFVLPDKIDYVLLTHAHMDHTADAIPVAKKHGATVVAIFELGEHLGRNGAEKVISMGLGGTLELPGVAVTMVEAKHTTSIEQGTEFLYAGVAAGYVLTIEGGPVLYHAGDTAVFRDMELIQELYAPEVAILPIGGFYTMGPREAAVAARFLKPKLILPIHWGTFPPLKGTPQELAKYVGDPKLVALVEPGEALAE